jgi:hypothetical protein
VHPHHGYKCCAQVHCPDNVREYTDKPPPDKVPDLPQHARNPP